MTNATVADSVAIDDTVMVQIAAQIESMLIEWLSTTYNLSPTQVDPSQPATAYGLDSVTAVSFVSDVEGWLNLKLPPTIAWDYPSIEAMAQGLAEKYYQIHG